MLTCGLFIVSTFLLVCLFFFFFKQAVLDRRLSCELCFPQLVVEVPLSFSLSLVFFLYFFLLLLLRFHCRGVLLGLEVRKWGSTCKMVAVSYFSQYY